MRRSTAIAILVSGFLTIAGGGAACAVMVWSQPHAVVAAVAQVPASGLESAQQSEPPPEERDPVAASTSWQPSPASRLPLRRVNHRYFHLGYDEQAKNPAWVAYQLSGPITVTSEGKRPATFATDFKTSSHVSHRDYSNTGYDRGHLCPAYAIFSRFGDEAMRQTFVMSNVIPQFHGLNAGEWEELEAAIAGRPGRGNGWAGRWGPVWVINGPVYPSRPAPQVLKNGTWIPSACFSVVLRQTSGRWEALGFLMPNQPDVRGPYTRYLVSIAQINRDADLDVLVGLPVDDKRRLESGKASTVW